MVHHKALTLVPRSHLRQPLGMAQQIFSKALWPAPAKAGPASLRHRRSNQGSLECLDICKRKAHPA